MLTNARRIGHGAVISPHRALIIDAELVLTVLAYHFFHNIFLSLYFSPMI
jgi:hypothetical protein